MYGVNLLKKNEMAEENRLIKQPVLGTYDRMKVKYPISRNRNQNNSKDDSGKQISQSCKKSVQFKSNISIGTGHSSAVTHSGSTMPSILKSNPNLATSTNSVSTIAKETESQWKQERFLTTPYITFKHIKAKDNILANSLT